MAGARNQRVVAPKPAPEVEARPVAPPTRGGRSLRQKRAHDTRQRLFEAAEAVFSERGFDETQTPDIAERAGVSVGTFYRYFADKRQIFLELMARRLAESFHRVMSNVTPEIFAATRTARDRRAAIDRVIDVLAQQMAENPRLHRVFIGVAMRDEAAAKVRDDFDLRGRQALAALIRQIVPRSRISDADAAAHVIQIAGQDVAFALAGLRGPPPTRAEAAALRGALAEMLYRYVFGES